MHINISLMLLKLFFSTTSFFYINVQMHYMISVKKQNVIFFISLLKHNLIYIFFLQGS